MIWCLEFQCSAFGVLGYRSPGWGVGVEGGWRCTIWGLGRLVLVFWALGRVFRSGIGGLELRFIWGFGVPGFGVCVLCGFRAVGFGVRGWKGFVASLVGNFGLRNFRSFPMSLYIRLFGLWLPAFLTSDIWYSAFSAIYMTCSVRSQVSILRGS